MVTEGLDLGLANKAGQYLRRNYQKIKPKKRWPITSMFRYYPFEGRALSLWGDAGWGQMVVDGKYNLGRFSNDLVHACVEMIKEWNPDPFPRWVTCIPSGNHPRLVPDFAERLAEELGLPYVPCIQMDREHRPQKGMENSYHQAKNLDGAFRITDECRSGGCLLVDDMIDSGWTFTVASVLLRKAGCKAVYPLALAQNSPRIG